MDEVKETKVDVLLPEQEQSLLESALLDNKLEFDYRSIKYRIKKPSFKEKQETYKRKSIRFSELIRDKTYMLEADLKKQFKERGIDLDEMTERVKNLEREKDSLQLKLGEAIVKQASDSELKTYKEQIATIKERQLELLNEKNNYLEFSIENQLFGESYSYLLFLCAEKLIDEKWVKAWATYQDFEVSDEELVRTLAYYSTYMLRDEVKV